MASCGGLWQQWLSHVVFGVDAAMAWHGLGMTGICWDGIEWPWLACCLHDLVCKSGLCSSGLSSNQLHTCFFLMLFLLKLFVSNK